MQQVPCRVPLGRGSAGPGPPPAYGLPQREYFKRLESCFNLGLPGGVTAIAPYERRIHGVLYDDYVAKGQLPAFLQLFPTGEPGLMELTNAEGVAVGGYRTWRRVCHDNPHVYWVSSANVEYV
jgi:hypothetical protein